MRLKYKLHVNYQPLCTSTANLTQEERFFEDCLLALPSPLKCDISKEFG